MVPTENIFLQMFARSPFKPMREHIHKVQACAGELSAFFDAVILQDWEQVESVQQKIVQLENEADVIKKDIRVHLPSSLFLPVPRTDLLEIVRMQDKIANRAKDISGLVIGRKMLIPEPIKTPLKNLLDAALATVAQANTAIEELDELVSSGFSGREIQVIESMLTKLDELEHKADESEREVRTALFAIEKTLDPIDVMFLYQVISQLGDLGDKAQQVGSRLQLLVAR